MYSDRTRIMAYLARDPLRNLTALKYCETYPNDVVCYYHAENGTEGTLLLLPVAVSAIDRLSYPDYQWLAILSVTQRSAAEALLPYVPSTQPVVIKTSDPYSRSLVQNQRGVRYARSLYAYTTRAHEAYTPSADVAIVSEPDPRCIDMWTADGYAEAEIDAHFARGALAFTMYQHAQPVSTCFAYPNYQRIWEVTGLHTLESERKHGLGRRVIQTALHRLLQDAYVPRYQVEHTNYASIRLAESLQMERALQMDHYML